MNLAVNTRITGN